MERFFLAMFVVASLIAFAAPDASAHGFGFALAGAAFAIHFYR